MEFHKVIRDRKSTRMFSKQTLEKEILDKILEAGRIAPTAKNSQAFKIYVINSDEGIKKLDKATRCRYGSSCVLMICGDKDGVYKKDDHSYVDIDCSIVTTHMMLAATNEGVDNIWIGIFDKDILIKEFDIPENLVPVALLPLGYKAKLCPPSPFHNKRKSIEELVEYR